MSRMHAKLTCWKWVVDFSFWIKCNLSNWFGWICAFWSLFSVSDWNGQVAEFWQEKGGLERRREREAGRLVFVGLEGAHGKFRETVFFAPRWTSNCFFFCAQLYIPLWLRSRRLSMPQKRLTPSVYWLAIYHLQRMACAWCHSACSSKWQDGKAVVISICSGFSGIAQPQESTWNLE